MITSSICNFSDKPGDEAETSLDTAGTPSAVTTYKNNISFYSLNPAHPSIRPSEILVKSVGHYLDAVIISKQSIRNQTFSVIYFCSYTCAHQKTRWAAFADENINLSV